MSYLPLHDGYHIRKTFCHFSSIWNKTSSNESLHTSTVAYFSVSVYRNITTQPLTHFSQQWLLAWWVKTKGQISATLHSAICSPKSNLVVAVWNRGSADVLFSVSVTAGRARCIIYCKRRSTYFNLWCSCMASSKAVESCDRIHQKVRIYSHTITFAPQSSVMTLCYWSHYAHSPCPDRSRCRLCLSLPSNISKVYLPLSFSVGLNISIQTFCIPLPGFVLASWSTLLSLWG